MGAALAIAFQEAGLHVYATARNPSKMSRLESANIETLTLDILSAESIAACVAKVPSLDILVNNAGASYSMPISDLSIGHAKQLFDINVWAQLAVTQGFPSAPDRIQGHDRQPNLRCGSSSRTIPVCLQCIQSCHVHVLRLSTPRAGAFWYQSR